MSIPRVSYKGPAPRDPVERFWEHVDVRGPDDCWPWLAGCYPNGYGRMGMGSRADDSRRDVMAHRFAWELEHSEIPKGMNVCHQCDNPPCVNVEHLFLGTQADNLVDMHNKGRGKECELHCCRGHLKALHYDNQGRCKACRRQLYAEETVKGMP